MADMPFTSNEYGPGTPNPTPGQGDALTVGVLTVTGAATSGSLVSGSITGSIITANTGFSSKVSSTTITTPAVPAASTDYTMSGTRATVITFLSTGTGVSFTLKDANSVAVVNGVAPSVGTTVVLPTNWKINLGAYTVAPTWAVQAL